MTWAEWLLAAVGVVVGGYLTGTIGYLYGFHAGHAHARAIIRETLEAPDS